MRKGAGFIPALFILRIQPLGLHPRSLSGRLRDRRMPSCFDGSNRAGPWRARDLWSDNIYYVNFKTFRVKSPWGEAVAPWSFILHPIDPFRPTAGRTPLSVGENSSILGHRARIMHEPPAATADMAVLPGVLGPRTLRRTNKVRLRSEPLRLPGGTARSTISLRRLVHNAG